MKSLIPAAIALCLLTGAPAAQMNPEVRTRGRAIEAMIQSSGEDALRAFASEQLAPGYRASFASDGELLGYLARIREAARGFGNIEAEPAENGGTRFIFLSASQAVSLVFRLDDDPPHRIVALEFEGARPADAHPMDDVPPYTWNTVEAGLDSAAADGFSGAVLAVHGGKIVLHRGFGLADREHHVPIDANTIFAIGSVPIDFTKAAILRLEADGKLKTSDPITRFIKDVPEDKRALTIDQLMSGASGLPQFHHIADQDADPDLTWIDRATAIRRIMSQPLLFAPGEGEAESHSAWVLLAAVVEMASGKPYGDYLRTTFFQPAGMTRTGLHEDAARFTDHDFAVGYGGQTAGKINTPRYWGKTSWLVMGSGGMFSTPMDLYRWLGAMRAGKLLPPEAEKKYWTGGVLAGGDDRGFFCIYTEGPGDLFVMCSNSSAGPDDDAAGTVARRLVGMVMGPRRR